MAPRIGVKSRDGDTRAEVSIKSQLTSALAELAIKPTRNAAAMKSLQPILVILPSQERTYCCCYCHVPSRARPIQLDQPATKQSTMVQVPARASRAATLRQIG